MTLRVGSFSLIFDKTGMFINKCFDILKNINDNFGQKLLKCMVRLLKANDMDIVIV